MIVAKKAAKPSAGELQTSGVFDLESLVRSIQTAHQELAQQATRAINVRLTVRNWLIGHYIAEYELNGADRATYGDNLLERLAVRLRELGVGTCEKRQLYQYLRFYHAYPEIVRTVSALSRTPLLMGEIVESSVALEKVRSVSAQSSQQLIEQLSYSQFELLVAIDSDAKRAFYETECIRGCWSVRELKRQINSLLYERSELSIDKQKLRATAAAGAETAPPRLVIRDPYVFDFLGLKPQEVMSESNLEDELLNKLQEFLMELGNGFCFEARQRRIRIGDKYYFIDLVFYHRLLKCHILIDLKLEEFTHENIGQLNTYVAWYDKNVRAPDDNPPIGILLCTEHDRTLVEYALASMSHELFVSKYQLQLPDAETLRQQIATERKRLETELEKQPLTKDT
jgi:predicted nuclease of restriction endonuclease-like (RecB) superfamily